jgi:hypothetical protein
MTLRALTLTQPWAGLVASGIKLVENRPRKMIGKAHFGKRFAIHASREIHGDVYDRIEEIAPDLDWCRPQWGSCDLLGNHSGQHWTAKCGRPAPSPTSWTALSRITSAVIAVATLDSVVFDTSGLLAGDIARQLGEQGRWFFGPIGYVLRDVTALPSPVPCRGWQGFWTLDADTERRVMEQL